MIELDVPVTQVGQVRTPVTAFNTSGLEAVLGKVPVVLGRVKVGLPADACDTIVAVPEPEPAKPKVPPLVPGTPRTGVGVNLGRPKEAVGLPQSVPPSGWPLHCAKAVELTSAIPRASKQAFKVEERFI